MASYQVRLLTRTGAFGPILEPDGLTYSRGLNNTGRCQFTASLDHPALTESVIEPWANEVLLLRTDDDGATVAHDGPITDVEMDDEAGTVTITAGPVSAWLARRWQRRSVAIAYGLAPVDLDTIAAAFVFLAQHPEPPFSFSARADLGIGWETHLTGTTRRYILPASERRNWLEELNALATGNPSFDWDILTTWDGSTRTRTARTWAPSRGGAVSVPLVRGRGMVGLKKNLSGDRSANYVEAMGNGGTALVSDAKQNTANQDTYGLLELIDTSSDINVKARLDDRALEQLRLRLPPTGVLQAGYVVSENLPFGFAGVGDTLTVQGTRGPLVVDGTFRAVAEDITADAGGIETVIFTFQDPLA